jgi:hypothetical protein
MIGFLGAPTGDCEIEKELSLITLSKSKTYMHEYIEFHEEDELDDAVIAKFNIFTGDKKLFNPWSDMHRLILNASLINYEFKIEGKPYTKKKYFHELIKKDNALLLEEPMITEILFDLGFAGFHSDDRGYRLYNIFEPHKYLTLIETEPYKAR